MSAGENGMRVDVIIPTYKPDEKFVRLVKMLNEQTVPVNRIIVINTEEKWFEQKFYGSPFLRQHPNVEVHHISKAEFDHAGTRHTGVLKSHAEVFVCMTDDAVPKDEHLIARLLQALEQPEVAVAYARQLPDKACGPIEAYTRKFNYPKESLIKGQDDIQDLGIKTYFCSNVCAAYKREIYDALGGFSAPAIFNEDMVFAAAAVKEGYKIAYAALAAVIHSHNYSCKAYFQRNFDMGVSQADHPEVFQGLPAEGEGIRMVKKTAAYLHKSGQGRWLGKLIVQSGSKYLGYRLGKQYKKLPGWMILKCSSNQVYWKNSYFL